MCMSRTESVADDSVYSTLSVDTEDLDMLKIALQWIEDSTEGEERLQSSEHYK